MRHVEGLRLWPFLDAANTSNTTGTATNSLTISLPTSGVGERKLHGAFFGISGSATKTITALLTAGLCDLLPENWFSYYESPTAQEVKS